MSSARVALALGSGGARGYAHIGVIQVLDERGYEIVSIAGTSMGALVGGLRAAGRLEPYADWACTLTQRDVLRLLDPSIRAPGVIRADRILAKVSDLLAGALIEDLPIPFTAVATDLLARKEVWLQRGPLDAAIRASIAIPTVITPVMVNGRLLVDGGLMNPVPVVATTATTADLTIAVSLSDDEGTDGGAAAVEESAEPRPMDEWLERSRRSVSQMLEGDLVRTITSWLASAGVRNRPASDEQAAGSEAGGGDVISGQLPSQVSGALPPGLRTLDVMQLALTALEGVVTRYRLAGYPPDLLITVPSRACRTLDFHRAAEMIALGRQRTIEALDRNPTAR